MVIPNLVMEQEVQPKQGTLLMFLKLLGLMGTGVIHQNMRQNIFALDGYILQITQHK